MVDASDIRVAVHAALAEDRNIEYRHGVLDLAAHILCPGIDRAQAFVRLNNPL